MRRRTRSCSTYRANERDEQGSEVLDEQRDPDREPLDGEEVEPLHERNARHAEDREQMPARAAWRAASAGRRRRTATRKPTQAPVERTWVSSSGLIPDPSTTFDTVPLTAKRHAASSTIA